MLINHMSYGDLTVFQILVVVLAILGLILIGSIISSLLISLATRFVTGGFPSFGRAYGSFWLVGFCNLFCFKALEWGLAGGLQLSPSSLSLLNLGIMAGVASLVYAAVIKTDENTDVSIIQGFCIWLFQILLAFGFFLILCLVGIAAVLMFHLSFPKNLKELQEHPFTIGNLRPADSFASTLKRGSKVRLLRPCMLYFKETPFRQGASGELFEVAEYRLQTHRVFLLTRNLVGDTIAVNVPEDAVGPP